MICHAAACNKTFPIMTRIFLHLFVHTHLLSRLFQLRVVLYFFPPIAFKCEENWKIASNYCEKNIKASTWIPNFFRWLFRFHSHCHYYVPRFRPSLYFTSSLFPNLPAVASKIILLRKSYVFTLQWFCIHADSMENAWFYFGSPWLIWQFVVWVKGFSRIFFASQN